MRVRIWQEGSQFGFDSKSYSYPLTVWITTNCWKIAKEMGILDDLTYLLQNLYIGQEATVRTRHGTMDWFKIGKGVQEGCILLPCLFNLYAKYIMWNARLDELQAGIEMAGRNIKNFRYADDITMMSESDLKEPFDEGKRRKWKSWFKIQLSKN